MSLDLQPGESYFKEQKTNSQRADQDTQGN